MKRVPLPTITNCDDCGACCTGQAALPINLVGEHFRMKPVTPLPQALADELRATAARFLADKSFPPDGSPCIWYDADTRRCKHSKLVFFTVATERTPQEALVALAKTMLSYLVQA